MFNTNTYFEGKVVSMGFSPQGQEATLGVMAEGSYTFSTSKEEHMTLVTGQMQVKLPQEENFKTYKQGETFVVAANTEFDVIVATDTAYLCLYKS